MRSGAARGLVRSLSMRNMITSCVTDRDEEESLRPTTVPMVMGVIRR